MVAAPALIGSILSGDVFEPKSESHSSDVTRAIERRSEVVLVALGQQGIKTAKDVQTIWGIEIPGSDRAVLLQYSFTAKLGIDGSLVTVKEAGPKNFTISIPAFQLIGFDDFTSSVAVEQNGVLSWVTPEIDPVEYAALFAECKWTNEKVDLGVLDTLIERSNLFAYQKKHFFLFSKSGFTKGCAEKAKEMGSVSLIKYSDILADQ